MANTKKTKDELSDEQIEALNAGSFQKHIETLFLVFPLAKITNCC